MSLRWKALPLALALAVLSAFSAGCGAGSAQIRVINAIPDAQENTLDVYLNGGEIVPALAFGTIHPSTNPPATYINVPSGSSTITAYLPGQNSTTRSTPLNNGTTTLTAGIQYTVVLNGYASGDAPPFLLTDNNYAPTGGYVDLRMINASPSSPPNGVDVYIVPTTNENITGVTPQISALAEGQAFYYSTLVPVPGGFALIVTTHGSQTPLITPPLPYNPKAGSITTFVLFDNPGGNNGMSDTPLVVQDLN